MSFACLCRFGTVTGTGSDRDPSLLSLRALPLLALALALVAWPRAARADDASELSRRWASPQPTGEALTALWGSDAGVWAVGDAGTILRSADHGATWSAADSGTTRNLKAIWAAPDEGDLWVAGESDTVLRSTDGGAAWRAVRVAPLSTSAGAPLSTSAGAIGSLQAIWGSGPHDVYFVGDNGRVLHTDDHGRSFTTLRPLGDTDEQLTSVWGSSADDLYVAGDRGSVLTSSDHGQRWVTLRAGSPALSIIGTARGDLVGSFSGASQTTRRGRGAGFAAEHTQDGGKTWREIRVEPTPSPWPDFHAFHAGEGRTILALATFELWDRPVEERQRLGLIVSRDGGATFERRSLLPSGAVVNALWRDPTGPLIAVGALGTILRSRDDGRTWEEGRAAHPFGTATLHALWTDGASEVWAVGDQCTILHSSDAGFRFELMRPCPAGTGTELRSVWGGEAGAVYVGGAVVSRTVDGGQHWAVVTPPAPVTASWRIWGGGAGDLYAAGYGVWRSTDDAQNWRLVDGSRSRNRNDWFAHLFGAGTDRFAVTQLGRLERGSKTGASWQPVTPPSAAPGTGCCAYWADGTTGLYAFGPNHAFFRSKDAGRSFQPVATGLSNRASFIALHRHGGALFVLAQDANPLQPSTTLLRSLDDGASFATYALLPAGCTTLGTVDGGLLAVGANGLIVSLRGAAASGAEPSVHE